MHWSIGIIIFLLFAAAFGCYVTIWYAAFMGDKAKNLEDAMQKIKLIQIMLILKFIFVILGATIYKMFKNK